MDEKKRRKEEENFQKSFGTYSQRKPQILRTELKLLN